MIDSLQLGPANGYEEIRAAVCDLCARFTGAYWRELDRSRSYPGAFVVALTEAGYLAALIPEEFGGSGLGVGAAAAILEEIRNLSTTLRHRRFLFTDSFLLLWKWRVG